MTSMRYLSLSQWSVTMLPCLASWQRGTMALRAILALLCLTFTLGAQASLSVSITSPPPNTVQREGTPLGIKVEAIDTDTAPTRVQLYSGTTLIAELASGGAYGTTYGYYLYPAVVLPVGIHTLTVVATDGVNPPATSSPVEITVNALPTVSLTNPIANQMFATGSAIPLMATAADSDGTVSKVDFYRGSTLIGTATAAPYTVTWSNAAAGSYSLTAKATDNRGDLVSSAAVPIVVAAAPTVSLTAPTANQVLTAPATVTLTATAAAGAGSTISQVSFYQGTTWIGTATASPYTATWSNAPAGSYSLTAKATDHRGIATTSAPVQITVGPATAGVYYIYSDHLGTPRLVTDSNNNPVWRNLPTTEPFGNTPPETDPMGTGNPFQFNLRFPGQFADRESNLNYNFFRDYDPSSGRYTTFDPIGLRGGINGYSYVNANPLKLRDPLGLWSTEAHNHFIDAYFEGKLSPELIDEVKTGSAAADFWQYQLLGYAHMHAMRESGQSIADAKKAACAYVQRKFDEYADHLKNGRTRQAYFALGMALHTAMDSTSPVHAWKTFSVGSLNDIESHGAGVMSGETIYTANRPYYEMTTLDAIDRAMQGAPGF